MFSNLQRLQDQRIFKQQYSPQQQIHNTGDEYIPIVHTVKKYQKSSHTPTKRLKTLEDNYKMNLNVNDIIDRIQENQMKSEESINIGKNISPSTFKSKNLNDYLEQSKQTQKSHEKIREYQKLKQYNKNPNQSSNQSYLQPQQFEHLPLITPKSSKLANVLGTNNKAIKNESQNTQTPKLYLKQLDYKSSDTNQYRFYTPQKIREDSKTKTTTPMLNKSSINNQVATQKSFNLKQSPTQVQDILHHNETQIDRMNTIIDQAYQKTLKKKINYANDQILSARPHHDTQEELPSRNKSHHVEKQELTSLVVDNMSSRLGDSHKFTSYKEKVFQFEDPNSKMNENKYSINKKDTSLKSKTDGRNYLHIRNNTTQFDDDQMNTVTSSNSKIINRDLSFDTAIKHPSSKTNARVETFQKKMIYPNSNKLPEVYISDKAIKQIKSMQDQDQLMTQILKPFESNHSVNSVPTELFTEYFNRIDTAVYEELLSHIHIDRFRYLIKVSLVYEWMAMIINYMIRINMVQNKSGSEQIRFTRILYANNLILKKTLLNALDGNGNLSVHETIKANINFIEQRCSQFFKINHTITPNIAQLNTLLSYISESIVIMNMTNSKLQDQAREYYRLRIDTNDLKVFINIIQTHFIPELSKYVGSKKKISTTTINNAKVRQQSPKSLIPVRSFVHYLPPVSQSTYTLVLDLDETLVHFSDQGQTKHILVRPFVDTFLKELSKYYELVVFTAGLENYANWVLDQIDPKQYISHRLYRQHTQFQQDDNSYLKDLTRLGRALDKTIIIDNTPQNFSCQKQNGIQIRTWFNDPKDTALCELVPFLKTIRESNGDVRTEMSQMKSKYRNQNSFVLPQ